MSNIRIPMIDKDSAKVWPEAICIWPERPHFQKSRTQRTYARRAGNENVDAVGCWHFHVMVPMLYTRIQSLGIGGRDYSIYNIDRVWSKTWSEEVQEDEGIPKTRHRRPLTRHEL